MPVSPRITLSGHPDPSSLESLMGHSAFKGKKGQELAIELWRYLVSPESGTYHFWAPCERETGMSVLDPLKLLNVFGFSVCGVQANLLSCLFSFAGLEKARNVQIRGHHIAEVFYDGAWHLFDPDLHAYHMKHPPNHGQIASYEECVRDPSLIHSQKNPSDPYYLPDRTAKDMAELYKIEKLEYQDFCFEKTHSMDFVLRPGERILRSWKNEGRWIYFKDYRDLKKKFPKEWSPIGPWERFSPYRTYGNGRLTLDLDFKRDAKDYEALFLSHENIVIRNGGISGEKGKTANFAIEFDSPYLFAAIPDTDASGAPCGGSVVSFEYFKKGSDSSRISVEILDERLQQWNEIASFAGNFAGHGKAVLDISEHVCNRYRYVLRFRIESRGEAEIEMKQLKIVNFFILTQSSLPALKTGVNSFTYRSGAGNGEACSRRIHCVDFRDPAIFKRFLHSSENLEYNPHSAAILSPRDASNPFSIVFKLDSPSGFLRNIYVMGLFQYVLEEEKRTDRVLCEISEDAGKTWRKVFDEQVRIYTQKWHFLADAETAIESECSSCLIRFTAHTGALLAKFRLQYLEKDTQQLDTPILLVHKWIENGEKKEYSETIPKGKMSENYQIECHCPAENESVEMISL